MGEAKSEDAEARVARLTCWRGRVAPEPLSGGLSNRNFLVRDGDRRCVVRLGEDVPVHGLLRRNEIACSRAAAACGLSPELVHAEPGVLVFAFIDGRTLAAEDVRADAMLPRVLALVRRCHDEMPRQIAGAPPLFWVFHALRDYARTLRAGGSRMAGQLPRLMAIGERLERAVGPIELKFGHNDLLAANLIDDGGRLWLIDWEYGGFNSPLFDLGNLASNNGLSPAQVDWLLAAYDGRAPVPARRRAFDAMTCASLLREAMWGMVQEIHSALPIDYVAYTSENLGRFEAAWSEFAGAAA
ncbi:MAG: phosphotransferase family protein [Alphaproteobacteria bacterium]|nr:phosphotransferase family protein [Alphaproteobacteria bacterium]